MAEAKLKGPFYRSTCGASANFVTILRAKSGDESATGAAPGRRMIAALMSNMTCMNAVMLAFIQTRLPDRSSGEARAYGSGHPLYRLFYFGLSMVSLQPSVARSCRDLIFAPQLHTPIGRQCAGIIGVR
jgi:hypothetical protein